jgi:hypothetical protein
LTILRGKYKLKTGIIFDFNFYSDWAKISHRLNVKIPGIYRKGGKSDNETYFKGRRKEPWRNGRCCGCKERIRQKLSDTAEPCG